MKIKKISYHNQYSGWRLEPMEFSDLNLLVGASGVGKTRILKALLNLKRIAGGLPWQIGESLNGVKWDVEFAIGDKQYQWIGEFETSEINQNHNAVFIEGTSFSKEKSKIVMEQLFDKSNSSQVIVDRNHDRILFKDSSIPAKLSAFESVLVLFREDENVVPVYNGFAKNIIETGHHNKYDYVTPHYIHPDHIVPDMPNDYYRTEHFFDRGIATKLAIAHEYFPDIFDEIKLNFIEAFPIIEDITIKLIKVPQEESSSPLITPVFYIKETNIKGWLSYHYLSAGMLKVLTIIADMYLCNEETVVLIDELENSLGVNCIGILNDIFQRKKNLQYITTSHHPYIINNVAMSYWKIITRKGSTVESHDADGLRLGKSKHEAFMQLMQLDEFTKGVVTE